MTRPRILLFCRTYLPGFRAGGPVRTLSNMVAALGEEFDFNVVTLDRDYGTAEAYEGVEHNRFVPVDMAQVRYMRPDQVTGAEIDVLVSELRPSVIYLNSLLDRTFSAKVLACRRKGPASGVPTVLAVRGQLNHGALALNRRLKRGYIAWLKLAGLIDGIRWQATGKAEEEAIRHTLGTRFVERRSLGVAIAPNVSFADFANVDEWRPRIPGTPLRILLLGRVSPMKNIGFAIDVVGKMSSAARLEIAGPFEDLEYLAECRRLADALPSHVSVEFSGSVEPHRIRDVLEKQDCFLLPTRGENFGHAIAEALAAGLPPIISDRTPWKALGERGVGRVLPLGDPTPFAAELDRLAGLSSDEMRDLRRSCVEYAKRALENPAVLEANRRLFLDLLSPESVR